MSDSIKKYEEDLQGREISPSLMMLINEASIAGILREVLHKYAEVRQSTDILSDEVILKIAIAEIKTQKVCD